MFLALTGCSEKQESLQTQSEEHRTRVIEIHGEKHVDEYHWIRGDSPKEPPSSEVLKLIDEENKKHSQFFSKTESDLNDIYNEISSYENGRFYLPTVYEHFTIIPERNGDEEFFSIYAVPKDGSERILIIDQNERAKGLDRYEFAYLRISPSGKYVAWVEYVGVEELEVFQIKSIYGDQEIIYKDDSNKVNYFEFGQTDDVIYQYHWKSLHRLNPFTKEIELLIKEDEEKSAVGYLSKSADNKYLFKKWVINNVVEYYAIDLTKPDSVPKKIIPRSNKMYSDLRYSNGKFYVLHDANSKSLQIDSFVLNDDDTAPPVDEWNTHFVGNKKGSITNFAVSLLYAYFTERIAGVDRLLRMDINSAEIEEIDVGKEYPSIRFTEAYISDFDNAKFRFNMQSYLSPTQVYEINEKNGEISTWKSSNVKELDPDKYVVERQYATSHDEVEVPITIIRKADTPIDGTSPVHLYVYGAYGDGIGPEFPKFALPLIDRGFIYAIAHVRGGNELGYKWYEDGKLMNKLNSIEDFLSVSQWLIDNNYAKKGKLSATGESAGGVVIGAAINRHPDWYQAVALQVPFLDMLNALLDETLPYTKWDWNEFGNPAESKEAYDYIKSYSPIDNIKAQDYPNILLASATNDITSGHWEVMKYMTKLRDNITNDPILLVQVRDGGHISGKINEFNMGFAYQLAFLNWVANNAN
jgi:oligopeptidase B